jgi:hypothetical protein
MHTKKGWKVELEGTISYYLYNGVRTILKRFYLSMITFKLFPFAIESKLIFLSIGSSSSGCEMECYPPHLGFILVRIC